MSGGISATTVLAAAAGVSAVASIYGASQAGKNKPAAPPAPEKPPQAAKSPEVGALRRQNASAEGGPGMSSSATLLTGPSGIDTSLLNLGKSTLLGQ